MVSRDPEPKFTKFGKQVSIGQRPQWCQISHPPTASVRDIRCQKFVLPAKVDQSSPDVLCNNARHCAILPVIVPNFVALGQTVYEKSVTIFLNSALFWRPKRTHWVEVHQSRCSCIASPFIQPDKFRPVLTSLVQDICCQISSILYDKKTKKQ